MLNFGASKPRVKGGPGPLGPPGPPGYAPDLLYLGMLSSCRTRISRGQVYQINILSSFS